MRYLLDTHILLWRLLDPVRLPKKSASILASSVHTFLVPAIVLLEMQYLREIGRVVVEVEQVLEFLRSAPEYDIVPYDVAVMAHSLRLTGNRDPFDRIILAHALATSTTLLSKDRWMKKTAPHLVAA